MKSWKVKKQYKGVEICKYNGVQCLSLKYIHKFKETNQQVLVEPNKIIYIRMLQIPKPTLT